MSLLGRRGLVRECADQLSLVTLQVGVTDR